MLQRIQSLYLLIASIAFAFLFFLNVYTVETTSEPVKIVSMSITTVTQFQADNPSLAPPQFQILTFTFNMVLLVLVIVTIFWYKNRTQQNLLARFCILLNSGFLVLLLLSTDKVKNIVVGSEYVSKYQIGVILPLISLVLIFLASRAITKDDHLVKSADRLR